MTLDFESYNKVENKTVCTFKYFYYLLDAN